MRRTGSTIVLITCLVMLMMLSGASRTLAENLKQPFSSSDYSIDLNRKLEEAELLSKLHRYEEAIVIINMLMDSEVSNKKRVVEIGVDIYQATGNYTRAYELTEMLESMSPENQELIKFQAELLYQMKEYSKARTKIERYHEKVKDDYRTHHLLGDIYAALGDGRRSQESYERALGILQEH